MSSLSDRDFLPDQAEDVEELVAEKGLENERGLGLIGLVARLELLDQQVDVWVPDALATVRWSLKVEGLVTNEETLAGTYSLRPQEDTRASRWRIPSSRT